MKLTIVIFACGRDQAMVRPCVELAQRTHPDATVVVASDSIDPVRYDGNTVVSEWGKIGLVKAVPDALMAAVMEFGGDVIIKTDCDTAHLKADWLEPFERGYEVVGFRGSDSRPWMFDGPAYAITRDHLFRSHAGKCSCDGADTDSLMASLKAYIFSPNKIWLWPRDPLGSGKMAKWNPDGCRDHRIYANRYDVVHCGTRTMSRSETTAVIREIYRIVLAADPD
jgi:hypothetical protein